MFDDSGRIIHEKVVEHLNLLPDAEREAIIAKTVDGLQSTPFIPSPGPQTDAYFSKADVLLYGGCVSAETEFLTPIGWKRIDEYNAGDAVGQWDGTTGLLTYVLPEEYTRVPCNWMYRFSTQRMSMELSAEHRMPLYNWDGTFVVKTAAEIAAHPSKYKIPTNYKVDRVGLPLSEMQLRLAVAVHADGNMYVRDDGTGRCRIPLRKQRKIDRLLWLFAGLGISASVYQNKNRTTEIRYSFDSPVSSKTFDQWWWNASAEQLEIILDEISYWDGDYSGAIGGDISYTSTHRCDVDFIQYAAHSCGRIANIRARDKKKDNHAVQYRVNISRAGSVKSVATIRCDTTKIEKILRDEMFCFTVPTSFWLARNNGKIFITGNSPGGGKSALEIGLALNEHYRSLILRRNFVDALESVFANAKKIVGDSDGFVGGMRPRYDKPDGGVIHFAGLSEDGGIGGAQGVDHDLICFDEAAQIAESQFRLVKGWLRTERKGQRVRVVLASNPPLDSTGDWLVQYFAPWLDARHHNPAKYGELRYFLPDPEGGDRECGPDEFIYIGGIKVGPESRTYIPSKFTDNPYYNATEYAKTLAGLPEEHRERLITGDFMKEREDAENQVIPTAWVKAAMERWISRPPEGVPMCGMAVDCSGGGRDPMVITRRYDAWFDEQIRIAGKDIPMERSGSFSMGEVVSYRRDGAPVTVDMSGGYGGPLYERLKDSGVDAIVYKGAEKSYARTKDGKYGFVNIRSEAFWMFREALDPDQPFGSPVCLPNDPKVLSDLTAPTFEITARGVKVESKEDVAKKLKRSTDDGDSIIMNWRSGMKYSNVSKSWKPRNTAAVQKVIMGYAARRRNK